MYSRYVFTLISGVLIGACSSPNQETDVPGVQATVQEPTQPQDKPSSEGFSFDCGPAGTADVRFLGPNTVELSIAGMSYILPQERAASGAKYVADGVSFWNKGDEALIEIGEEGFSCTRK